jgi:hypothetical protein
VNPIEGSLVGQIGAGASGDEAGRGCHRLRFVLRGIETARPAATQHIVNKLRNAIGCRRGH